VPTSSYTYEYSSVVSTMPERTEVLVWMAGDGGSPRGEHGRSSYMMFLVGTVLKAYFPPSLYLGKVGTATKLKI
jgi:hypothetical protein